VKRNVDTESLEHLVFTGVPSLWYIKGTIRPMAQFWTLYIINITSLMYVVTLRILVQQW